MERVVITGLGTVNPLGNNIKSYWKNIKNGNNGIKKISLFDTSDFKVKIAGEVKIDLQEYFSTKDLNKLDRFSCFAIIAADQAIKDSNIDKLNRQHPKTDFLSFGKCVNALKILSAALDKEAGKDLAENLENLYVYCSNRLREYLEDKNEQKIIEVREIISGLLEAWEGAENNPK